MVSPAMTKARARRVSARKLKSSPEKSSAMRDAVEKHVAHKLEATTMITSSSRKRSRNGTTGLLSVDPSIIVTAIEKEELTSPAVAGTRLHQVLSLDCNLKEDVRPTRSSTPVSDQGRNSGLDAQIFSPTYNLHKSSHTDEVSHAAISEPSRISTNHQTATNSSEKGAVECSTASSVKSINGSLVQCTSSMDVRFDGTTNVTRNDVQPLLIATVETDVISGLQNEVEAGVCESESRANIALVGDQAVEGQGESTDQNIVQSELECRDEQSAPDEEYDDFDPFLFIKRLPKLSDVVPPCRPHLLPKQTRKCPPITLVLDLDETLVHSTLEPCPDADFTFPVHFNGQIHTVYVRRRPHLDKFMERVAHLFEIIVFTASQSIYAEQLLNILDPQRKLIRHRVFRDSCVYVDGNYLKDLSILGRDLAKVAIIDNSPQAFGFQIENGIPIDSWFDDKSDCALDLLLPFLESLVSAEDVRPLIAKRFNLQDRVNAAVEP